MTPCELCTEDGCLGVVTCPRCHEDEHNDATIPDHGMCHACHKAWQHGEESDDE